MRYAHTARLSCYRAFGTIRTSRSATRKRLRQYPLSKKRYDKMMVQKCEEGSQKKAKRDQLLFGVITRNVRISSV